MNYWLDIGSQPIDRPTTATFGYTIILKENPADHNGILDKVALYADEAMKGVIIASFYKTNTNKFSTRDTYSLGTIPAGFSEWDCPLEVKIGDYIGYYSSAGKIKKTAAAPGIWYLLGNHIPCTNLTFTSAGSYILSVFGWKNYIPPGSVKWYLTAHEVTLFETGFTIVTTTNRPCHMYLRHSRKNPEKHLKPIMRRGIALYSDARYCFVSYRDIGQNEPGDTLIHTFTWEPWTWCAERYYYFWAMVGVYSSPSTSPIFHLHYLPSAAPYETWEKNKEASDNLISCQYTNAEGQTFEPDHNFRGVRLSLMLNQYSTTRRGPYTVKVTRATGDAWNEPILQQWNGYSTHLPLPGVKEWTHFTGTTLGLVGFQDYRIVVHTLPGWEWWNGEEWVPTEAYAALQWWSKILTNPYTRGFACYGVNFWGEEGSWREIENEDMSFIIWQKCPSL